MKKYSDFFKTLHDESTPTGCLGRGSHYSVLRSMSWHDETGGVLPRAHYHDLAIIWDEDHDERVILVMEFLYQEGLLSSAKAIGERKGGLTLLLSDHAWGTFDDSERETYLARAQNACDRFEGDCWPVTLGSIAQPEGIINAEESKVVLYIGTIDMLWQLGVKPIS